MVDPKNSNIDVNVTVKNLLKHFYVKVSDIKSKKEDMKKELDSLIKRVNENKGLMDIAYNMEEFKISLVKIDTLLGSLNSEFTTEIKKDQTVRLECEKKMYVLVEDILSRLNSMLAYRNNIADLSNNLQNINLRETIRAIENSEILVLETFSRYAIYQKFIKLYASNHEISLCIKESSAIFKKEFSKKDKSLKTKISETKKKFESVIENWQEQFEKVLVKIHGFVKKGIQSGQFDEIMRLMSSNKTKLDNVEAAAKNMLSLPFDQSEEFKKYMTNINRIVNEYDLSCNQICAAYKEFSRIENYNLKIQQYGKELSNYFDRIKIDSICTYILESSNNITYLDPIKIKIESNQSIAKEIGKIPSFDTLHPKVKEYSENMKALMQSQWSEILNDRLSMAYKIFEHAKNWSIFIGQIYIVIYSLNYIESNLNLPYDNEDEGQTRLLDISLALYNKLTRRLEKISTKFSITKPESEFFTAIKKLYQEMHKKFLLIGSGLIQMRKRQICSICFVSYSNQICLMETILSEKEVVIDKLYEEIVMDYKQLEVNINKIKIMMLEVEAFESVLVKMKKHIVVYISELVGNEAKGVILQNKLDALQLLINELFKKCSNKIADNVKIIGADNIVKEADVLRMMADVTMSIAEEMKNSKPDHPSKNFSAKILALKQITEDNRNKIKKLVESIETLENPSEAEKIDVKKFVSEMAEKHDECDTILLEALELNKYMQKFQRFSRNSNRLHLWIKNMYNIFQFGGYGRSIVETMSMIDSHNATQCSLKYIEDLVAKLQDEAEEAILLGDPCLIEYRQAVQELNKIYVDLINGYYFREKNLRSALTVYYLISDYENNSNWIDRMIVKVENIQEVFESNTLLKEIDILEELKEDLNISINQFNNVVANTKETSFPISIIDKNTIILIGLFDYTPEQEFELEIKKDHLYFLIFEYDHKFAYISNGCQNGFASMRYLRKDLCSGNLASKSCSFPTLAMIEIIQNKAENKIKQASSMIKLKIARFKSLSSQCILISKMEGLNLWIEAKNLYISKELHPNTQLDAQKVIQTFSCLKMEMIRKKTHLISQSEACDINMKLNPRPEFEIAKKKLNTNFELLESNFSSAVSSFGHEIQIALDTRFLYYWLNTMKRQITSIQVLLREMKECKNLKRLEEQADHMKFFTSVIQTQYSDWLELNSQKCNDNVRQIFKQIFLEFNSNYDSFKKRSVSYYMVLEFESKVNPYKIYLEDILLEFKERQEMNREVMIEIRRNDHKDNRQEVKKNIDAVQKIIEENQYLLSIPLVGDKAKEIFNGLSQLTKQVNSEYELKMNYLNDFVAWRIFDQDINLLIEWMKDKEESLIACKSESDEASIKKLKRIIDMTRNKKEKYECVIDQAEELIIAESIASSEISKSLQVCKEHWESLQKIVAGCKITSLTDKKLKEYYSKMDQQIHWLNDRLKQLNETPKIDFDHFENQRQSFNLTSIEINSSLGNITSLISNIGEITQYALKEDGVVLTEKSKKLHDTLNQLKTKVQDQIEFYEKAASISAIYNKVCDQNFQLNEIERKLSSCSETKPSRMIAKLDILDASLKSLKDQMIEESDILEKIADQDMKNSTIKKIKESLKITEELKKRFDELRKLFKTSLDAESIMQEVDNSHKQFTKVYLGFHQIYNTENPTQEQVSSALSKTSSHIKAAKAAEPKMKKKVSQAKEIFDKIDKECLQITNPEDQAQMVKMTKQFRILFDNKNESMLNAKKEFDLACEGLTTKFSGVMASIHSTSELNILEEWSMKKSQLIKDFNPPMSTETLSVAKNDLKELEKILMEKEIELKNIEKVIGDNKSPEMIHLVQSVTQNFGFIKKYVDKAKKRCEIFEASSLLTNHFGAIDAWIAEKLPTLAMNSSASSSIKNDSMVDAEKAKLTLLKNNMKVFKEKQIDPVQLIVNDLIKKFPHAEAYLSGKRSELISRWESFYQKVEDHHSKVDGALKNQLQLEDLMQKFARSATQFCAVYDSLTEKFTKPASSLSQEEFKSKQVEFENLMNEVPKLKELNQQLQEIMDQINAISEDATNPHTWYTMDSINEMWNSLHVLINGKRNEYNKEQEKMSTKEKNEINYQNLLSKVAEEIEVLSESILSIGYSITNQQKSLQTALLKIEELDISVEELCKLEFKVVMNCTSNEIKQESGYLVTQNNFQVVKNKVKRMSVRLSEIAQLTQKNSAFKESLEEVSTILTSSLQSGNKSSSDIKLDDIKEALQKSSKMVENNDKAEYNMIIDKVLKLYEPEISSEYLDPVMFFTICASVHQLVFGTFKTNSDIVEAFKKISQGEEKISEFDLYQALGRELAEFCLTQAKLKLTSGDEGFNHTTFCQTLFGN